MPRPAEWPANVPRKKTSMQWPVVVDERLRILTALAAEQNAETGTESAKPAPSASAAVLLANLILSQPLSDLARLIEKPGAAALQEAQRINAEAAAHVGRPTQLGRPPERAGLP
ncbi:hypothetical protein [Mycobacteroides abscessus]|uniref:hypothetical protein n=1 Tax=Mycobacteroides abscessus TaxID=36809 RepID=UPI000C26029F|nr:hypothetical protein [Mycobacteroides abscessus]